MLSRISLRSIRSLEILALGRHLLLTLEIDVSRRSRGKGGPYSRDWNGYLRSFILLYPPSHLFCALGLYGATTTVDTCPCCPKSFFVPVVHRRLCW